MPAARPPAAVLGGTSLLLALLLGSPAAALAGDAPREGDTGPSGASLLPSGALGSSSGLSKESLEERVTLAPLNPAQSGEDLRESGLEGAAPSAPLSTRLPEEAATKRALPSGKKLPSLKQVNSARKQLRPKGTSTAAVQRAASPPASSGLGLLSSATEKPRPPGDPEPAASEEPLWLDRKAGAVPTTPAPLQISPFTSQPYMAHTLPQRPDPGEPAAPDDAPEAPPEDASPMTLMDKGENELTGSASEESQETTTSTIITTTVITTEQAPAPCSVSFSDPEGYIDSSDYPPLPLSSFLECTYNVTVYTGYGVELQVKSVNLSDGELLSIRGVDGPTLTVLANQTLLVEGQVIRSPTNTISVYFRTFQDDVLGTFQLHYQAFMLSCNFPRRPDYGDVTVMDLHPGGAAHFHCHLGYELQGAKTLTCMNASKPHWSSEEPVCSAPCGGAVHNATIGRVLSPSYPGNTNGSQFCVWTIEAPEGQKLHLHFERLSLHEKDRMMVYSGLINKSAPLYDSLQTENVPFEGLLSEGNSIRIEFTSDQARAASAFNIRFEAFEKGHCYEPYIQNGNFTTSDPTYNIGTTVEFTCDPGHSLEQGPAIIECINVRDPYWNDTEPLCRAMCGGELSAVAGVVLSPNWPEPYVEGEDCIWKIHVGEEKRIFLDIQFLNLSNSDILTIYDGDEVMPHILGQYLGNSGPQKLYSSTPDLTIQFHSDPAGLIFGKGQGFIMNYVEVSRNDSCSDLPEIQNGWKTTSHTELVRGARITYQCDPGYDIVGSDTLTCQWDLSWSSDPPFCEKIMYCTDPGEVDHSTRLISDPVLLVGTTIQYTCNPGFVLEGSSLLTCYSRETGTPIWTSRLPHCVSEESLACDNPGLPENGYQILYKRLYLPGESLTFMCYEGFELMGEVTIRCILGQPSHWNGPLPVCKVNQDSFEHALEVAEAAAETSLEGGNMALAIFIPVLIISLLLGGAYIYITRCRYYSNLRLPLMYSHPYSQITVETEFDNPIYETGETREYEVSI
ncbi:seizure 6-like protein isoform X1 [Mirounga angustirostris]|uniref:seizure 6-like protein n=1 Tax=Mirounga leonina TaxID=9715 RepID=UPI00156C2221|nr:seizure 6-like protein [Mirounga leonina]XP_045742420.1 seizure 6-like protein isoform X1 [Mirounga angustirostris]